MFATITGNAKEIIRITTGLYLLDRAFINDRGDTGVPVGAGYEIYGLSGIGKSTFAFSLSALLGKIINKNIVVAALEDYDSKTLLCILNQQKFEGNVHILGGKSDEDILDGIVTYLHKDDYAIGIVDSLGAISPISEQQGDLGEANMGRRAFLVAQLTRKCMPLLRPDQSIKTIILLNHYYPKIGSRGYTTPAGETKRFITTVQVLLRRVAEFTDGSYVLEGEVKKNRWGFKDRKFYTFMVVGLGLHQGLTALWDCTMLGLGSYKNGIVMLDKEKLGRLSKFVKAAKEGDTQIFEQFYIALNTLNPSTEVILDEEVSSEKDIEDE